MADNALDADALRRDRQRYQRLLEQVQRQITAWSERAEHLQTMIGGLDQLLVLTGDEGAEVPTPTRRSAPGGSAEASAPAPPRKGKPRAASAPPPTATPAAPEPVEPPAGSASDAPRGTDALRLVLEGGPQRTWSLPELLEALGARGWLPTSRRPEEGVRISLKRLVERGGATRTDDGRWRLAGAASPAPAPQPEPGHEHEDEEPWPDAEPPRAGDAAATSPAEPPRPVPPPPPLVPRPASFGRPVGGTVTEL